MLTTSKNRMKVTIIVRFHAICVICESRKDPQNSLVKWKRMCSKSCCAIWRT